ncbi:MAG TPA: prolyl oligopeptidase family serine peptidase, partial [Gemmatimonadaceae bacterium]|nr:prolyl oligopeptidase family serine peptidase [Gemmatimonadaceae bacterium]
MALTPAILAAQQTARVREPLPLDVALSLHSINLRSPIALSPDGQWVALTVATDETVTRDTLSSVYTATGFPLADGISRMQATLTNTSTGETIRLGTASSSSWGASWSPDGRQLAFYSDEGGTAGIWVWTMTTRRSTRFPGVIARPFFGFETVRWASDGRRMLCKILPERTTIAEANAKGATIPQTTSLFKKVAADQASVVVRAFDPGATAPISASAGAPAAPDGGSKAAIVDLAILDNATKQVTRLARGATVQSYAFSPDEKSVAWTVVRGSEPNTQQSLFDLIVHEPAGASRIVAAGVRLAYGAEWSWSPDGRTIAYTTGGQIGGGEIVLASVRDGSARTLKGDGHTRFTGENAPLWDATGANLYAIGEGKLFRVDASSGAALALDITPAWRARAIATPFGKPTIWTSDGHTAWITARASDGARSGFLAVDLATGASRVAFQENRVYGGLYTLDANDATGAVAFVSADQLHLQDVWIIGTRGKTQPDAPRQLTRLNDALDHYALGESKIIESRGADGVTLKGALLLPPGYQAGRRVPLVVYAYGGVMGSANVNTFGLLGDAPQFDMQILATRGYAVLYPDAPVRTGSTATDIARTVMQSVDAAVDQGYADPDRIAVMGQSYGSYGALSLITQTKRFKAAILTGVVVHPDLFVDYLRSTGYYEHGQGNMGGTIWEQRSRYYDNSPLFSFDRIETPVLIGQGERDGSEIATDIFTALQRLGKKIEFRLYQGEGHILRQRANVRDFWERRLAFLAESSAS